MKSAQEVNFLGSFLFEGCGGRSIVISNHMKLPQGKRCPPRDSYFGTSCVWT
jgi:hypothetical protein